MKRRSVLLGLGASTVFAPSVVRAQVWPHRPIRFVVGWPAGGSVDAVARLLQPLLQQKLGVPVIIDNRGGASGVLGAAEAVRAEADGYTWLMVTDPHATNESMMQLPFKALDVFNGVSLVATCPMVIVANSSTPYKDMRDVAAAAKQSPNTIGYASAGTGGLGHVATVLLQQNGGFALNHIPYKGGAPALQDTLAGHVQLFMANSLLLTSYVKDAKLRALGVGSERESKYLPGVKSFVQQGFKDVVALTWYAVLARRQTSPDTVKRMDEAIKTVLVNQTAQARFEQMSLDIDSRGPDQTEQFVAGEIKRWAGVIRDNKIKSET